MILLVTALALGACSKPSRNEAQDEPESAVVPVDSAVTDTLRADSLATLTPHAVAYTRHAIEDPKHLRALIDSLGEQAWTQTLKLNRVDLAHVRDRDSLILPDRFGDSLTLAPFPAQLPSVRDTAKLVLVSLRLQAFAAYDSGRLVQWGPTSTGRRTKQTPAGLYHANWKDRERISTVDDEWQLFWCVNIENREGVSLHQYELPGRPASHSCVRLLESDAMWLYAWTEQWRLDPAGQLAASGTPVVIFGEWEWGRRAPWKRLPEEPDAATLQPSEIDEALRMLREADAPDFRTASARTATTATPQ